MTLLAPLALLFLAALPVIVLLHLLRDRRPRVPVSSLVLWRRLKRPTPGPRLKRLPITWLLFVQLLLAALAAFALAYPQLTTLAGPNTHTIILLDTSTSMAATDVEPTRFASARDQARDLIAGLRGGDTATLIRMSPRAERAGAAGAGGRDALLARLDALQPGGEGVDLAGALALAGAAVDPARDNTIVVLTDAAFSPQDLDHLPPSLAPIAWRLFGRASANQAIIAFNSTPLPDGQFDVFARVAHYDLAPLVRQIELRVDGQPADRRSLSFQAESDVSLSWTVPAGTSTVELALRGEDALPDDDRAVLSLAPPPPARVLLVAGTTAGGAALERALRALPALAVTRLAPGDYHGQAADLTVFESTLPQTWPATGGVLVVSPPADRHVASPAETDDQDRDPSAPPPGALTSTIPPIQFLSSARAGAVHSDLADALLHGVDLSGVRFGNLVAVNPSSALQTVAEAAGGPLILRARSTPPLVVLAFDLAQSSLPERVAFPLLIANAVAELTPPPLPPAVKAGEPIALGALDAADVVVSGPNGQSVPVGERPPVLRDTLAPGLYTLAITRGDGSVRSERFAVHAGSPRESDLRPRSLVSLSINQNQPVQQAPAPQDLWPWLAALGLAALVVEGWLHWRR